MILLENGLGSTFTGKWGLGFPFLEVRGGSLVSAVPKAKCKWGQEG